MADLARALDVIEAQGRLLDVLHRECAVAQAERDLLREVLKLPPVSDGVKVAFVSAVPESPGEVAFMAVPSALDIVAVTDPPIRKRKRTDMPEFRHGNYQSGSPF